MNSDKYSDNSKLNEITVEYFNKFSKDGKRLTEDEFYKSIYAYLENNNHINCDEWSNNLRSENYFGIHAKEGEYGIDLDTYYNVLQEVDVLCLKDGNFEIENSLLNYI